GIPLPAFADAIAPGIVVAQAIGRLGNYFNQELYGGPTDLPRGLVIYERADPDNPLITDRLGGGSDRVRQAVVLPTFLYELLWSLAVAAVIVWADRKLRLGHGRVFALYVAGYTLGRTWIEMMRTDPATHVFGVRVNVWVSILVFLGAVVYFVLARKRGDREPPELLRGTEPGEKAEDDDSAEAEAEPVNHGANSGTDGDEPKQE